MFINFRDVWLAQFKPGTGNTWKWINIECLFPDHSWHSLLLKLWKQLIKSNHIQVEMSKNKLYSSSVLHEGDTSYASPRIHRLKRVNFHTMALIVSIYWYKSKLSSQNLNIVTSNAFETAVPVFLVLRSWVANDKTCWRKCHVLWSYYLQRWCEFLYLEPILLIRAWLSK